MRALQPWVSRVLASGRLDRGLQRALDLPARLRGRPARADLFLQLDDPHGWLMVQVLRAVEVLWDLAVTVRPVAGPDPTWETDPAGRLAWALEDVQRVAPAFTDVPPPATLPDPASVRRAQRMLAAGPDRSLDDVAPLVDALWSGDDDRLRALGGPEASEAITDRRLLRNAALRRGYGHGDGLWFAGAWYGGADRIEHLTAALDALTRRRVHGRDLHPDWRRVRFPPDPGGPLRFYFAFGNPYAAVAAWRIFDLGRRVRREVEVRLVPPLEERGVPFAMRLHQFRDAARLARLHGVPFGAVRDPRPAWRDGAALAWAALAQGRVEAALEAWVSEVWGNGVDATTPEGLARVSACAGLTVFDLDVVRRDPQLEAHLVTSRGELEALGARGLPCVTVGDVAVWGADRLDALEAWLARSRPGEHVTGLPGANLGESV